MRRYLVILALIASASVVAPASASEEGGYITGRLTNIDGEPAVGECVTADHYLQGSEEEQIVARTDADGRYRLGPLPPNSYKILQGAYGYSDVDSYPPCHESDGRQTVYRQEWYKNAATEDEATPVLVASGEDTPGIDAVLSRFGIIEGRVTDSAGAPIEGACVVAQTLSGHPADRAKTGPTGRYRMSVTTEQVRVVFSDCEGARATEWFDDARLPMDGAMLTIADETETEGVDAELDEGAAITVHLDVERPPVLLPPITRHQDQDIRVSLRTGERGTYRWASRSWPEEDLVFTNLPRGRYFLFISGDTSSGGTFAEWHDGAESVVDAVPIDLDTGEHETVVVTPRGLRSCGYDYSREKDGDEDGITDCDEFRGGTAYWMWDTDSDGLGDGEELFTYQTNPLHPDTDADTFDDGFEVHGGRCVTARVQFQGGSDPRDPASTPAAPAVRSGVHGGPSGLVGVCPFPELRRPRL